MSALSFMEMHFKHHELYTDRFVNKCLNISDWEKIKRAPKCESLQKCRLLELMGLKLLISQNCRELCKVFSNMTNQLEIFGKLGQLSQSTETFLSPDVQELVFSVDFQTNNENFIEDSYCDDISCLSTVLLDDGGVHKLQPSERSREWYLQRIKAISPYLAAIHDARMRALDGNGMRATLEWAAWMHQSDTVELCFHLLTGEEELGWHEALLLLTAALERALGNLHLFASKGKKKVPSLLRDLLASHELRQLLGDTLVVLLQLLMGSPRSLNLRNLVWHGFVNPGELNERGYVSVLLFTCAAIGRQLSQVAGVRPEDVVPRRWFKVAQLPDWSPWNEEELVEAIAGALGLPPSRRPVLRRALDHHLRGDYGRCCALLLPELEHLLRLIFCAVNNCPDRIATAESVVHYTTMDVILDGKEAAVKSFLGSGLHSALVDLLAEPAGPRIRDRFSHGECRMADADLSTSRILLSIALLLLNAGNDRRTPEYIPAFSLTALFHRDLITAVQAVGDWVQSVTVADGHHPSAAADDEGFRVEGVADHHPAVLREWLHEWSWPAHERLIHHLEGRPGSITLLDGPQCWRRVLAQLALGCRGMTLCLASYRDGQTNLRSRQRSSYERLEANLPLFVRATQLALSFPLADALSDGEERPAKDPADVIAIMRNRKRVTRWSDNFAGAPASHRWVELAQLARHFLLSIRGSGSSPPTQ